MGDEVGERSGDTRDQRDFRGMRRCSLFRSFRPAFRFFPNEHPPPPPVGDGREADFLFTAH